MEMQSDVPHVCEVRITTQKPILHGVFLDKVPFIADEVRHEVLGSRLLRKIGICTVVDDEEESEVDVQTMEGKGNTATKFQHPVLDDIGRIADKDERKLAIRTLMPCVEKFTTAEAVEQYGIVLAQGPVTRHRNEAAALYGTLPQIPRSLRYALLSWQPGPLAFLYEQEDNEKDRRLAERNARSVSAMLRDAALREALHEEEVVPLHHGSQTKLIGTAHAQNASIMKSPLMALTRFLQRTKRLLTGLRRFFKRT